MRGVKVEHKEGIYKITNVVNKKVYIGESKSIYKRWWDHRDKLRTNKGPNPHLQRSWNKYGEDCFKFEILEIIPNSTKEDRLLREAYWTKMYNSESQEFGYNIPDVHRPDRLNSRKRIPRVPVVKKMYQLSLESNQVLKIWDSSQAVANFFNTTREKLFKRIRAGAKGHYKGYTWVLEDKYDPSIDYATKIKERLAYRPVRDKKEKVKIYKSVEDYNKKRNETKLQNVQTGEIKVFISRIKAAEFLNVRVSTIYILVKGYKNKGRGIRVIISQWKGWRLVK